MDDLARHMPGCWCRHDKPRGNDKARARRWGRHKLAEEDREVFDEGQAERRLADPFDIVSEAHDG